MTNERKHLEQICEEQLQLEYERRQSKRRLHELGAPIVKKYKNIGEAVHEIVSVFPEGIRACDIADILRREGFQKKRDDLGKKVTLYQAVANLLFKYHERGIFRKLDKGVYAPRVDIYGEEVFTK